LDVIQSVSISSIELWYGNVIRNVVNVTRVHVPKLYQRYPVLDGRYVIKRVEAWHVLDIPVQHIGGVGPRLMVPRGRFKTIQQN
jgi:hypothetical protein